MLGNLMQASIGFCWNLYFYSKIEKKEVENMHWMALVSMLKIAYFWITIFFDLKGPMVNQIDLTKGELKYFLLFLSFFFCFLLGWIVYWFQCHYNYLHNKFYMNRSHILNEVWFRRIKFLILVYFELKFDLWWVVLVLLIVGHIYCLVGSVFNFR